MPQRAGPEKTLSQQVPRQFGARAFALCERAKATVFPRLLFTGLYHPVSRPPNFRLFPFALCDGVAAGGTGEVASKSGRM